MKLRHFLAATLSFVAVLGLGLAGADAKDVRYGLWAKKGEAQHLGALKFKEVLEKESNGAFNVIVYPGNQLGTPREMLAQLAVNTTQIMASGDPGIKEVEYLALPYLMKSLNNYVAVIGSSIGDAWNKKLIEQRKVRLLGFLPRSPRQISSNKPINKVADLKGMKLRVPERDYYVQSFVAFGAKPTPMAFKEVYTSLQTGIVDGQENPIETIWAMKFHEVQKAVAMVDYIDKPAYTMIGEKFWQGLSEKERGWMAKAQAASQALVEEILPKQQKELLSKMKAAGLTITYPDKAEFRAATQGVRDKLGAGRWGEETYKKIVAIGQQDL
ncbi:MAG: TRAP transporter substrate-binding protein [Rhodospirillales bacterium]|jgi:TRAP-type transport system periplasmic protein|nr:TRAP transporter substrate-binding protein [Rhodospirillales bacterium]